MLSGLSERYHAAYQGRKATVIAAPKGIFGPGKTIDEENAETQNSELRIPNSKLPSLLYRPTSGQFSRKSDIPPH